jgi:hypothetical protein
MNILREQLESKHRENQAMWKEGETDHQRHKYSPWKISNDVDPLLGNNREISDYTTGVSR